MHYVTRFYDRAFSWVLTYGPRLMLAIIIFIIGQWLLRILNRWIARMMVNREFSPSVRTFLRNLISVVLQGLLVIMLMQVVGFGMTLLTTIVAGFSVAAGLALSGTLQNFASGVLILMLKPYRVGEIVITQGQEGVVTSIQLFYTVILAYDNKTVIVPNSKLSNEIILNLSRQGNRRVDIELKFKFNIQFEKLKQSITRSLTEMRQTLNEPAHRVGVSKLEADGYNVIINTWIPANEFENGRLIINEQLMDDLKNDGFLPVS